MGVTRNQTDTKDLSLFSCRWTEAVCCCCGSLTPALLTLVTQVTLHLTMLTLSCVILTNTDTMLDNLIHSVDTRDR